jgi:hypothetical protein
MTAFLYLEVPHGHPANPDASFSLFKQKRYQVERQLLGAKLIKVERQDLVDGRRIFRVHPDEQKRLMTDNQGPFIIDTTGGKVARLRFTDVDPSEDQAVLEPWKNTRS